MRRYRGYGEQHLWKSLDLDDKKPKEKRGKGDRQGWAQGLVRISILNILSWVWARRLN